MGKDHRGKPSGVGKNEGLELRPDMPPEKVKQDNEMTDKYIPAVKIKSLKV